MQSANMIEPLEQRRMFSTIVEPLGNGLAAVSLSLSGEEFHLVLPESATPPSPIVPADPCLPGLIRAAGGTIIIGPGE